MRTGKQRWEATIQSVASTQDAIGGEIKTASTATTTWYCELNGVSGSEVFRGKQVHGNAQLVAVGQWVSGVTSKHRLVMGARTFDILRAYDPDGRTRELRLDLLERGT